jgi:hypothetical protein
MQAKDTTFTAQWSINQYTITFDSKGGSEIAPITQDFGTAVESPADPTREGYTFAGWDGTIPATMPAKNSILNAKWNINQYTLTFKKNDNEIIQSNEYDYNTVISKEDVPANPDSVGYTFAGWDGVIPAAMPAKDSTLTANWTINQYTISFVGRDGTIFHSKKLDYKSDLSEVVQEALGRVPEVTGKDFQGWKEEIPATMPANDLNITANYGDIIYNIVWLEDNGAEFGRTTAIYGETFRKLEKTPVKTGYTFQTWLYKGGSDEVDFTAPYAFDRDTVFVPDFTVNQYTINFDTDG